MKLANNEASKRARTKKKETAASLETEYRQAMVDNAALKQERDGLAHTNEVLKLILKLFLKKERDK